MLSIYISMETSEVVSVKLGNVQQELKNYLINEQEVLNERIVLKDGGYREALTIEFYIQPPNFTMSASPTLTANEAPKKCGNQK
jgi:hypothetical protein